MLSTSSPIAAFLLCGLAAGAAQPDSPGEPEPPLFAAPTQFDRVGRIVAQVTVNGRGPFNLLVDTGANSTTFSSKLADELGMDYRDGRSIVVNGVTGRAPVPVVSVERLQAGALILTDQQVPVIDPHVLADADGILGIAALTDKQLVVDFRRNVVSLGSSQRLPDRLLKVKAKRLPTGLLVAPAFVGNIRCVAIIDTGAERTLGNRALQTALKRVNHNVPTVPVLGTTSEVAHGVPLLVRSIQLGEVRVSNSRVTFGDFHIFDVWDLSEKPALILGMDVIGRVDVFVIDFRRMEIGIQS